MVVEFEEVNIAACLVDCVACIIEIKQSYDTKSSMVNIELMTKRL